MKTADDSRLAQLTAICLALPEGMRCDSLRIAGRSSASHLLGEVSSGYSMRFRIYKSGALWIFVAMDMLVGQIPLATSNSWFVLMVMADKVSVNYRLQSLSRC